METQNQPKLLFSNQLLRFPTDLRFIWHIISIAFYLILAISTILFLLGDIDWLRWMSLLFGLFLLNRIKHFNKAVHSIRELDGNTIDGINVDNYLLPSISRTMERALDKSLILGGNFHLNLLKILIKNKGIRGALWRLEVSPEQFEQKLDEEIAVQNKETKHIQKDLILNIADLSKQAFLIAYSNQSNYITAHDIFAAVSYVNDEKSIKLFHLFSIDPNDLVKALIFSHYRYKSWLPKLPKALGGFGQAPKIKKRLANRAWTSRPTPVLDTYSTDISDLVKNASAGFLIGHENEYRQMEDVLARPAKPNVLLIGEPGSGKESIVNHLAHEIFKDKVPANLFDKRVVSLEINRLISGADPQEISKRVNTVVNEIMAAKNVILFIPDIHNLVKTSGNQFMNAADVFLPAFSSDSFQVIGGTYPREFKGDLEGRSDFVNAFEIIRVEEISEDDAIKLLTFEALLLETDYKVVISFSAIKQAVVVAHKYFRAKLLPSSAEDLMKEALAYATQKGEKVLKADHIIEVSERKTNIPLHKTTKEEAQKLLNLEDEIHKDMIDQEEAVKTVSQSLREYRSGLSRSNGPIAVFLFVGPTGVGKTELAKILAKTQFGSEEMMVRFDMSEYQDKQSVFRFIGSPDGKISGVLTESVVQKPYSLILLDEFEKANSDVLNIFLQVFDDGRLTDNLGRVVDFKNTIIIATSNALSDFIKEKVESGTPIAEFKDEFKKKLAGFFKPELLNRFSNIVIFKNLSEEDTLQIAKLQFKKLGKILAENKGINFEISDDAIRHISKLGYDPVFGARPLRQVISEKIKSGLADMILKEETKKGDTIKAVLEGEEIKFVK